MPSKNKLKVSETLQLKTIIVRYENDVSKYIDRRLSVLQNNAFIGIAILCLTLFLLLHKRVSFLVAASIPFVF